MPETGETPAGPSAERVVLDASRTRVPGGRLKRGGLVRAGHRHRRPWTIAGFYRYALEQELLDHSPAAHVRRPRLDYDSHAAGLDRNEPGRAAGRGRARAARRARQIPRRLLPPVDRYRQIRHSPPSTLRLNAHQPKVGLTELTMGGIVGTVSDCDEGPTRSLLLPPRGSD